MIITARHIVKVSGSIEKPVSSGLSLPVNMPIRKMTTNYGCQGEPDISISSSSSSCSSSINPGEFQ
jgi:hypothetical protein